MSVWSTLRAAIRGTSIDYTTAPVGRAVIMLAVPMVVEMSMESIFAVADVFWVSRLGADAVATVGLTESMLTLVYTVAMGVSIGATAVVARRTGEHDPDGAARAAGQSILLGLGVAAAIAALAGPNASSLLRLMGASDGVVRTGGTFTRIMLTGNATVLLLFLLNAVFRGAGDAAIAMRVLILGNLLNIVLGPCFIFGLGPFPHLGVAGAATATNIGRGTAVIYQIVTLARGRGRVVIRRRDLRPDWPTMQTVLRLSGTGTFQILIGTASYIGLVRILSLFGSEAIAGYTIGIRVIIFALLPAFGIANAAATMVGQNLGAGRPDRAERAVWTAAAYNMLFLGLVGLLFLIAAPQIAALFTRDPAIRPFAIGCLRTVSLGFVFYACGMVLTQSFNGAGDTWTPTIINLFVFWLWEIPLAWWLATRAGFGARGVFIALTTAYSTLAVVSAVLFRRGGWKTREV
ncbi:MAG TPA: MATE family efflux transporter [Vicinamibacterales bacterium]|jgi:putative MATE family efflux protein|nr:MATE family efflux transporter [Vicinamibacterales bacterium]